jgi:hypothetical protein
MEALTMTQYTSKPHRAIALAFTATSLAFDGQLNSLVAVRALDSAADVMSTLVSMRLPGGELRGLVLSAHRANTEAYEWLLAAEAEPVMLARWRMAMYAWELAHELVDEAAQ